MTDKEPGWYPDPIRGAGATDVARYWDGRAWTEHLRAATRAERRQWVEEQQAEARERVAAVRALAEAGDVEARNVVAAAASGTLGRHDRIVNPAGWGWRALASVIDGFLVQVLAAILSIRYIARLVEIFGDYASAAQAAQSRGVTGPDGGELLSQASGPFLAMTLIYLGVTLLFEVGFIATFQATPGKMLLHLYVEPRDGGGPVGFGRAVARWGVKVGVNVLNVIPLAGLVVTVFWFLDRLWPLWDPHNQALHDKSAGTIVVRTR